MTEADDRVRQARAWLARGAFGLLAGILTSTLASPDLGSWITVAALVVTVVSLHRFGRLGPE